MATFDFCRRKLNIPRFTLSLLLAASLTGSCVLAIGQRPIYISCLNKSENLVGGLSVYASGKLIAQPGWLVAHGVATEGPLDMDIPAEVEVHWVRDSTRRSTKLRLSGNVAGSARPRLYVVFDRDGSLSAQISDDNNIEAKKHIFKGLRPEGEYGFGFINRTSFDLTNICAIYGKSAVACVGSLEKRILKSYTQLITNAIPAEINIQWHDQEGMHSSRFATRGIVPEDFSHGHIFVVIHDDRHLDVRAVPSSDQHGADDLLK
jgi:hypothetical protein